VRAVFDATILQSDILSSFPQCDSELTLNGCHAKL